ncbi:hypothetical protein BC628DRAFT_1395379 [Trametes gibbosa]|nr:hypothetical protein BC628DRAFT_1395379 [Trametes gibbosa]
MSPPRYVVSQYWQAARFAASWCTLPTATWNPSSWAPISRLMLDSHSDLRRAIITHEGLLNEHILPISSGIRRRIASVFIVLARYLRLGYQERGFKFADASPHSFLYEGFSAIIAMLQEYHREKPEAYRPLAGHDPQATTDADEREWLLPPQQVGRRHDATKRRKPNGNDFYEPDGPPSKMAKVQTDKALRSGTSAGPFH